MKIHIVKKGDSLYGLSQKYEVELDKLIALNPQIANPDVLDIGMKVKIPNDPKPVAPPSDYLYKHSVVQGDTLWKLGKAWSVPLADMVAANPQLKNPNVLMTGDVVYIPKQKSIPGSNGQPGHKADTSVQGGAGHKADTSPVESPPKIDTSPEPMAQLPVEATPVSELPPAPVVAEEPAPVPQEPIKTPEPNIQPNQPQLKVEAMPNVPQPPNLELPYAPTQAGNMPPAADLFEQFKVPAVKAGELPYSAEPQLPVFPNVHVPNEQMNAGVHWPHAAYPAYPGWGANVQGAGDCGCGQPNLPYAISPAAEYPNAAPHAYQPTAVSPVAEWPNTYQPNAYPPTAVSPVAEWPNAYQPTEVSPAAEWPNAYQPNAYEPNAYQPTAVSPAA
ncbi:LysM repeat-containing protein, partial [Paenibacillus sp. UNCCL117]|uniref:LysM peptidoglycan-binding domain-containing protein n=1 Tax=unclassified Paenibacillus TaxID=185978 RepID=UPI00088AE87B